MECGGFTNTITLKFREGKYIIVTRRSKLNVD
jgi:hypothetical protein